MLPQSSSMQRRRGGPESGGASFGSGPESGGGKFWQWTRQWGQVFKIVKTFINLLHFLLVILVLFLFSC
jgi:hypothetical protein